MDCIDLTLSDSDDCETTAAVASRPRPNKRPRDGSPTDSSDVVVVEPDREQPKKACRSVGHQESANLDEDVVVTAEAGDDPMRDYPHGRPECKVYKLQTGVSEANSKCCPNCYCFVCDKKAVECQFWGGGARARDHCNAHGGSNYWDLLRKAARKGNQALLEKEHTSSAPQLTVSWANSPAAAGTGSVPASSRPRNGTAGQVSPAVLWARAANAAVASSEALLRNSNTPAAAAAAAGDGAGAAAAAAAAALRAGGQGGSGAVPSSLKSEMKPATPPQSQPQRPPASPWLQRMPHPRTAKPQMQLLATLELPIKTVKGLTVAELQQRLVPTGFFKGTTGRSPEYGDHLCLDNIANARYQPSKRKEKPDCIRLLPLVPPGGLPAAPSSERTWKFFLIPHDASSRPQAVAVTVERDCKLSAMASALKDRLRSMGGAAPLNPSEDLVFATCEESCDSWRWLRDPAMHMPDGLLQNKDSKHLHLAFKVPKGLLPGDAWGNVDNYSVRKTKMVLVVHEKTVPPPDQSGNSSGDHSADDSEDEYLAMMGYAEPSRKTSPRSKCVRFGMPQLVVLPEQHLNGGEAADKAVKQSLAAQLDLFCRPDQQPPLNSWPIELRKVSARTMYDYSYSSDSRFAIRSRCELQSNWDSPGIATLYAHWGSEPLAPPPGFNLEAFSALPQVADSADLQKLADMPKALAAFADYQASMKVLTQLPSQVLNDLRQACAASPPPASEKEALTNGYKPSAAAVLTIVAVGSGSSGASSSSNSGVAAGDVASKVAAAAEAAAVARGRRHKLPSSDRLGLLRVEVFIWQQAGRNHRLLAEDGSNWEVLQPAPTGRGRNFRPSYSSCQLQSVMNARLLQEPDGYKQLCEIESLKQAGVSGIAKLMQWLTTGERAAAQQPPGLNVQLHPYQLQSLSFMIEAEKMDGGWRQLLWRWLPAEPSQRQQHHSAADQQAQHQQLAVAERRRGVWWSPVLDRLSFNVPPAPWGGFLAEEMGLGKTVEVLGLVLSNPAPPLIIPGCLDPTTGKVLSRATLVVCAVSLVGQWCTEANSKLAGDLKIYPYHGSSRQRDPVKLATKYDVVVTTYQTLGSDFGKNGDGTRNPCHRIKWHRVVFDEGHMVKNGGAVQSKACVNITADRRWVCTGTPLNNDITDLLGQFAVLQMQPFGTKSFFDSRIKPAFVSHGYGISMVPLLYTLRHTLVRHTKAQTISGQNVLALPEKTEEFVPVVLAPAERRAYLDVHAKAAALWASVRHFPPAQINQRLLQIMSLLQPLRRICSGGQLRPSDLALPARLEAAAEVRDHMQRHHAGVAAAAAAAAAGGAGPNVSVMEDDTIEAPQGLECPICLDAFETPVMTPCHHWFCKECILGVLSSNTHCPLCRGQLDAVGLRAPGKNNKATPVLAKKTRKRRSSDDSDEEDDEELDVLLSDSTPEPEGQQGPEALECESKLRALLAELSAMRQADPSSKALVFSQYNSTLEWLKRRLPEEGFSFRTITGSMAQRQRARAIEAFQKDPPTTVFLLSMRSGAVGINLTAASHVFLLEPCLNPALEEQAIGRAWRMGQTRKVTVKRFYIKGSIEERIMDVRNIRQGHTTHSAAATAAAAGASAAGASGAGTSAAAGATPATPAAAATAAAANDDDMDDPITARGKKKVGAAVLAGNLKADKQVLKIAELDLLFRTPELDGGSDDGAGSSAAAAAAAVAAGTELAGAAAAAAPAGGAMAAAAAGAAAEDMEL